jgi:hypothetical protein
MAGILAGFPTGGGYHKMTAAWMAVMARRQDVSVLPVSGRPTDFVRNGIVRVLLAQTPATHLLMVDSDIEPPLDALDRLLALDAPLAGGCYPVQIKNGLRWALSDKDSHGRYRLLEELKSQTKPFDVDAGGAGCLLIRRDVLEKLRWPWFKWTEYKDGGQMSEDIYFFHKCNVAGFRLTVDPQVICEHYKTMNLTSLMRMVMARQKQNQ